MICPHLVPWREIFAPFKWSHFFLSFSYPCNCSWISIGTFTENSHWWRRLFDFCLVWKRWGLSVDEGRLHSLTKKYKHSAWWFSFKLDYRRKEKCGLNISFFVSLTWVGNWIVYLLHEFIYKSRQNLFWYAGNTTCLAPQMLQILWDRRCLISCILNLGIQPSSQIFC